MPANNYSWECKGNGLQIKIFTKTTTIHCADICLTPAHNISHNWLTCETRHGVKPNLWEREKRGKETKTSEIYTKSIVVNFTSTDEKGQITNKQGHTHRQWQGEVARCPLQDESVEASLLRLQRWIQSPVDFGLYRGFRTFPRWFLCQKPPPFQFSYLLIQSKYYQS